MFYIQLMGGIGNQLFQYAAARSLSLSRSIPFKVFYDDYYPFAKRRLLLQKFETNIELANDQELQQIELIRSTHPNHLKVEDSYFIYDETLFTVMDNSLIIGYWQNEMYFKRYEADIRKDLQLKAPLTSRSRSILARIRTKECPVSLHIRRGDYAMVPSIQDIHGLCSMEYYRKAIETIKERHTNICLFIFSDDIAWAIQNFDLKDLQYEFIDPSEIYPHEDLVLMSHCSHHIIANSTFSWWGAWLNPLKDKIVIAPRRWMTNQFDPPILNTEWITMAF